MTFFLILTFVGMGMLAVGAFLMINVLLARALLDRDWLWAAPLAAVWLLYVGVVGFVLTAFRYTGPPLW